MNLHEFEELDFDEALEILETRLIDLKGAIDKVEKQQDSDDSTVRDKAQKELDRLHQHHADIEERLARLRELKAADLAGENDNLLSETFLIFDQAGERIDRILKEISGAS